MAGVSVAATDQRVLPTMSQTLSEHFRNQGRGSGISPSPQGHGEVGKGKGGGQAEMQKKGDSD